MRFGGYEHKLDIRSTIQQPEGAAKFTFAPAMRDGRCVVAPALPEGVPLAEGQRIDLVLYVPQGHALSVDAAIGDIECRGLRSDIDLKTGPGRIQVIGTQGTVQAQSDDGRIEVSLQDGARDMTRSIIASVVQLARSMQLTVVAEGVEVQEQLEMLRGLGCTLLQGYLFGKPGPIAALMAEVAESERA